MEERIVIGKRWGREGGDGMSSSKNSSKSPSPSLARVQD